MMKFALIALAGVAAAAPADVILSNLPGTSSGSTGGTVFGTDREKAVGITMGADSLDFVSMVILGSAVNGGDLVGGIYSSSAGNPGSLLASFDTVAVAAGTTDQLISLTISGGFTLDAGTSYWFRLGSAGDVRWNSLTPNTAPTATGVTYDGYRFTTTGGASWSISGVFNGVEINAIPTPGALALLGLGGLAASRRRR